MSSLGAAGLNAIELAVHATGHQAVADMEARVVALQAAIQSEAAALKAGTIDVQQFTASVTQLNLELAQATAQAGAASRVFRGLPAGLELSNRGLVNLAYVIDDLQYGLNAIVNNVPQVVMAFGGSAGMAGAVGIAVVALNQLVKHWDDIKALFAEGVPAKLVNDLDTLKKDLDELGKKEVKTRFDYAEIDGLKRRYDQLTEAHNAYERLVKQQTKDEQKRGEIVGEGITEGGGAERLREALKDVTPVVESTATADIRKNLERTEANVKVAPAAMKGAMLRSVERLKAQLEAARAVDERMRDTGIENDIGNLGKGREDVRARIEQLYGANRATFERHGVTEVFGAHLAMARPETLHAEEVNKLRIEQAKKGKEATDKEAKEEEKAQEHFDEVAQENADRASRAFAKMEDDLTKATDKTIEEAAKAADKEKSDAAKARQKRVNAQVQRFAAGYGVALERTMEGHLARGATEAQSAARLQPQLEARLQREGVAPDLRADVARGLLGRVGDRLGGRVEAAGLELGVGDQQAAAVLGAQDQQQAFGRAQKERQPVQVSMLANQAMNQYGAAPDVALEFARKSVAMAQERHLTLQQTTQIVMRQMQEDQFKFLQQAGLLQMDLNLMQARQRQIGQRRRGLNEGIP